MSEREEAQKLGANPWNETGWFQGADGKWRFEIPDINVELKRLNEPARKDTKR